jgi:hypothetical protein
VGREIEERKESLWLLRSWVQIPPGPFFPVIEIRHCFEIVFGSCRTDSVAMPMPYRTVCPTFCPTKVEGPGALFLSQKQCRDESCQHERKRYRIKLAIMILYI